MSEVKEKEADTTEYEILGASESAGDPTGRSVRIEFAAISDPGKVRKHNEDHYLITRMGRSLRTVATNMPDGQLPEPVDDVAYGMVVADGMGGMVAGEKASQLAIRTGVELVLNSPRWATRIDDEEGRQLIARMREYFRKVDARVIGEARADRGLSGMGTTLTLAYTVGVDVFIVHVGDSRAYLFRQGTLKQLTRDHTVAQGLADVGAIRPGDVHRHSTRHVLTNFVGGPSAGIEPEVTTLRVRDGDCLLLCSDGLTEMVGDPEIAAILADAGSSPTAAARSLIARALALGGRDNVTVVLARYEVPPGA